MSIYRTSNKEYFLEGVAQFVITKFKDKLHNVKIILPNGYFCNKLQEIIVNTVGTTILPNIVAINDISLEKDEIFKIPSEQTGSISALEEKMILAQIANSYNKLHYNLLESLKLSSSLAKLFFEFEANEVDLKILKNIPILDQPEHWHFIYDFLEFAYISWQQNIKDLKKLSPANHQKLKFDSEIIGADNLSGIIIAGLIGNNKITQDFIRKISYLKNAHVILPPVPITVADIDKFTFQPEDGLYNFKKLIKHHGNFQNIQKLDKSLSSVLDNLLINNLDQNIEKSYDIRYMQFDNILLEANYVGLACNKMLAEKPDSKIAILITNSQTKDYFTSQLVKYNLKFSDLIGDNILNLPLTSLILEIAENICKNFVLKDFVSLISHPLVIDDNISKLKQAIAKKNRFATKIEDIQNIIESLEIEELSRIKILCQNLYIKDREFKKIFEQIMNIAEMIVPDLLSNSTNRKIADTISQIACSNLLHQLGKSDLETLPEIIKSLLSGGTIINKSNGDFNITLASANNVSLMNYDFLIYTNFVENSYPSAPINSPWLNNQMIENLGIDSWNARFGNSMYDFYLNLHNQKILITRSLKTNDSNISMESPFILKLRHLRHKSENILKEIKFSQNLNLDNVHFNECFVPCAKSNFFPNQISATDIETLMRAPYNFYAKKILNLRKFDQIEDEPKLSEFGNIFHKVVELYTINHNKLPDKRLKDYAIEILKNSIFPNQARDFWLFKIEALEEEFILFDNNRRSRAQKIFSEIKGEIELDICNTKIKIVSIADRVELIDENKIVILDYKTGTIPTKQDVLSGLSPQLMIEAIIMTEGGFEQIGTNVQVESLVYIKINSYEPFISLSEIKISKDEIDEHKDGLINLLTHYVTTGEYPLEHNLMKYDNYRYLARR